jgi:cell division protein FtsW (lipid II flippase)
MRMRAHDVKQARQDASSVTVIVPVVIMTIVLHVTVTVLMTVFVVAFVVAFVVRAAHAVHDIQHARINALPHINNYQGRALAN